MSAEAVALASDNLADYGAWLDGVSETVAEWDEHELVELRGRLEEAKRQLAGAIAAVEMRFVALVEPGRSVQAPGAGVMSVEVSSKRLCRGGKLAAALAARVADESFDRDTGAMLPPSEICARVAAEVVDVFGLETASTSFRSGKVKERNLRASEFYEYGDSAPRARFVA